MANKNSVKKYKKLYYSRDRCMNGCYIHRDIRLEGRKYTVGSKRERYRVR